MSFKDKILNNQSPWGSPPGGGGQSGNGSGTRREPPNLDDLIKNFQKTINKFSGGKSGGSRPFIIGFLILFVLYIASGLYRVLPDEQGVVLRFGKFINTTQPGLHYHFPTPFERVLTPKVTKVNRVDVGFRPASDTGRSSGVGNVPEESFFMKSLSFLSHKHRFKDHSQYKNYYSRIGNPTYENSAHQQDPEMLLLNWDVLKTFKDEDLFFPGGDLPQNFYSLDHRLDACTNTAFMKNLVQFKHSYMPLYMNGTVDCLLEKDCLGLKEVADYNNMLRKGYSLEISNKFYASALAEKKAEAYQSICHACHSRVNGHLQVDCYV